MRNITKDFLVPGSMDGQIVRKKNSRRRKCDVVFLDELDTELTQRLDAGDFSEPYTTIIMLCVTNKHEFIIGDARTQSLTTKNFASEPPTFGEIAGLNLAKCNAQVATWRNRLRDHSIPYAR